MQTKKIYFSASLIFIFLFLLIPRSSFAELDFLQPWQQFHTYTPNDVCNVTLFGPYRALQGEMQFCIDSYFEKINSDMDIGGLSFFLDMQDPNTADIVVKIGLNNTSYHGHRVDAVKYFGLINDKDKIPQILKLVDDEESTVEIEVYKTLAIMKATEAVPALIKKGEKYLAKGEGQDNQLDDLCDALGKIGDKRAIPFLKKVVTYNFTDKPEMAPVTAAADAAAESLGRLGDSSMADYIIKVDPVELRALRLMKHPEALKRAKQILIDKGMSGSDVMPAAWIFDAVRVYAEIGKKSDAEFLKKTLKKLKNENIGDVVVLDPMPLGGGIFYANITTMPVFFGWALFAIGDADGEIMLDKALAGNNGLTASETARVYVRMQRTDKYDDVIKTFRRLFIRNGYDTCSGDEFKDQDSGMNVSGVEEMIGMLEEQQTPEALNVLAQILNGCGYGVVESARHAIRTYPISQSLPLLEKQLFAEEEWGKWQIATQLEFSGDEGMQVLYKIANDKNTDDITRAVAIRTVVQNEMSGWKEMLCSVKNNSSPAMKELIDWAKYRFESFKSRAKCVF